MTSLLPPNSTDLERKLAEAGKDAFDLPSIRIIKDIDQVPSQFLPFIAWQKSVDYWDDNWLEELKRKVIKESRDNHRGNFEGNNVIDFLSHYGLYQNGSFTHACVVLFAKNPTRYLPQVRVRLTEL